MFLRAIDATPLVIPFTTRFAHAAATRSETASLWVTVTTGDGVVGQGESCPRPYVTGESVESAVAFVTRHRDDLLASVRDLDGLAAWEARHATAIDAAPAAWCAIELAILDALARAAGVTLEALLGLPRLTGPFRYTAVIGDGDAAHFTTQWARYQAVGFRDVKLKASGDPARDVPKLAALAAHGVRVRLDANNLWHEVDAALAYLTRLPAPLFALEEPLAPGAFESLAAIAARTAMPIVLDESATRVEHLRDLPGPPDRWIVNVRVSKMGGVRRALRVVRAARDAGHRVIVGAQVGETSLLTRAALPVAEAAGPSLVAMEGAFGTLLLTRDICDPPLMFGAGGRLVVADHPRLASPGLGVA
ncbi:MAG: enolase C-terminal domain-like protein [Vicinamibacterales bacterium]